MPRRHPYSATKPEAEKPVRKRPEKLAKNPQEQEFLDWLEKAAEDIEGWG